MVETWPCPQPCAPPGAWPRPPRSLDAAPCRGPAAQSRPTAGAVPVSPASRRKLQHRAGAARAVPRPHSTAPGCSESGPQQLDQPSEQPCHWGGPRREEPPGGDQQEQQPPAGTGRHAASCCLFALSCCCSVCWCRAGAKVTAALEPKWLSLYISAAGICAQTAAPPVAGAAVTESWWLSPRRKP